MKTHSGTKKRVKITGTGKFLMNVHHHSHKRTKKRAEKLYSLRRMEQVHETQERRLRRLLPYS